MEVTLKNFLNGDVTKQQVFDFVCRKLIAQGHASMYIRPNHTDGCAYNAPNGSHCAAGWLMTDLSPSEVAKMEGSSIGSLIDGNWDASYAPPNEDNYPIAGDRKFDVADIDFIERLQNAHDAAAVHEPFVSEFRGEAERVALNFNLDASVLAAGAGE